LAVFAIRRVEQSAAFQEKIVELFFHRDLVFRFSRSPGCLMCDKRKVCHPRAGGGPGLRHWIPAFTEMTPRVCHDILGFRLAIVHRLSPLHRVALARDNFHVV
jgi:hypothetical protein